MMPRCLTAALGLLLAAGLARSGPATTTASRPAASISVEVYFCDFEQGAVGKWSRATTAQTPKGNRKFLGEFVSNVVSLRLDDLPPHEMVRVSFDLYVILTWDGPVGPPNGPDIWELEVARGPKLLRTTFQFAQASRQSFPGEYPYDDNEAGTGAAERNTLGFKRTAANGETTQADSVYRLSFTFPHTGQMLQLNFRGDLKGEGTINDESWGLDNVKVEVLKTAERISDNQLAALWEGLGDKDSAVAYRSLWDLVAGGQEAGKYLKKRLDALAPDAKAVAALIELLDDDNWRVREKATKDLRQMGYAIYPLLREAQAAAKSEEVSNRLANLMTELVQEPVSPQVRRAQRALELITWQKSPASAPAGPASRQIQ